MQKFMKRVAIDKAYARCYKVYSKKEEIKLIVGMLNTVLRAVLRNLHMALGPICLIYLLGGSEFGALIIMFSMFFVEYVHMRVDGTEEGKKLKKHRKTVIFLITYVGAVIILIALYPYLPISDEDRIHILTLGMATMVATKFALKYFGVNRSYIYP